MMPPFFPPRDIRRLVEWDYYPEIRNDERRRATPAANEQREPRPDPFGVVLAKLFSRGAISAAVGWPARLIQARGTERRALTNVDTP